MVELPCGTAMNSINSSFIMNNKSSLLTTYPFYQFIFWHPILYLCLSFILPDCSLIGQCVYLLSQQRGKADKLRQGCGGYWGISLACWPKSLDSSLAVWIDDYFCNLIVSFCGRCCGSGLVDIGQHPVSAQTHRSAHWGGRGGNTRSRTPQTSSLLLWTRFIGVSSHGCF